MGRDELYFHRVIKFKALAQTKKALLVEIEDVKSGSFHYLRQKYGAILYPIQIWLPKKWFRQGSYSQVWIWEKGLMTNLHKLIEKRKYMVEDAIEEKKHIERLH